MLYLKHVMFRKEIITYIYILSIYNIEGVMKITHECFINVLKK